MRTSPLAVRMQAHDDKGSIGTALNALLARGWVPGDLIVVIADNCSDGNELALRPAA